MRGKKKLRVSPPYPGRIRLGPEAEGHCGFRFEVSNEHWRTLLAAGLWWIVPLGHRREEIVGIRILPGRPLRECPIVSVDHGHVATQASRPACLMPYLIWPGTVIERRGWDCVLGASEEAWRQLAEAHSALGGDDGLAGIRSVLADDRLAEASMIGSSDDSFVKAYREIRTRIDPAPESADFFHLLEWAVQNAAARASLAEAPLPSSPACWGAAAAAILLSAAAWELLRQPSGLDCFQGKWVTFGSRPGDSPAQMIQVACLLASEADECRPQWRDDPWWPCALSIAQEGERYAGLAHMDAASRLADAGRREEAFFALTSSAYWFSRATGQANPDLASAAQLLAAESGWLDTEQALVSVAEAINAALPRPRSTRKRGPRAPKGNG